MNILSLGAGVQSTTLALMAAHGEITPMPDAAIFADTGWEPRRVMEHLDWLETKLPFPVHRVMHKSGIREMLKNRDNERYAAIPFFMSNGGLGMRQCSKEYKIEPIQRQVRALLGYEKGQRIPPNSVTQWIGISLDEALRQKPSRERWITHRWPLIERRMTRGHCLEWMSLNGYPEPPKSACLGCPYHTDPHWQEMKNGDPNEWLETVEMDRLIRTSKRLDFEQFMHRSLKPLDEVVFKSDDTLDMWANECEGICGV